MSHCVCPVPIIDCIYIKSTLQTTCSERKMAVREQTAVQMYVCAIYWPNRTRGSEKKKVMYRGKKEPRGNMDDHILEKKWRIRSQVAVVANPVGVGLFKSPGLLGHKLNEIWRENISWFRLCTKTLIWVGGWLKLTALKKWVLHMSPSRLEAVRVRVSDWIMCAFCKEKSNRPHGFEKKKKITL